MNKIFKPIFTGLKTSSEELELLNDYFFRIKTSIGKIPISLYLERHYDHRLKRYYFNFSQCKSSLNNGGLIIRPIYKYIRRNSKSNARRHFSVILS